MEEKKKVYSIFIPVGLIKDLRRISEKTGIKISWLVEEAIKDFIVKKSYKLVK